MARCILCPAVAPASRVGWTALRIPATGLVCLVCPACAERLEVAHGQKSPPVDGIADPALPSPSPTCR